MKICTHIGLLGIFALGFGLTSDAAVYKAGAYGKWTDERIWSPSYPGTVINVHDTVFVDNHLLLNTALELRGSLFVHAAASLSGNKEILIASTGKMINNGNVVAQRILNVGEITNDKFFETVEDLENRGNINNNKLLVAGGDFNNVVGKAGGNKGEYYVNNHVTSSYSAKVDDGVRMYVAESSPMLETKVFEYPGLSTITLETKAMSFNGVVLQFRNPKNEILKSVTIEKSFDGVLFGLLGKITKFESGEFFAKFNDAYPLNATVHYKIGLTTNDDNTMTLPVATVPMPGTNVAPKQILAEDE